MGFPDILFPILLSCCAQPFSLCFPFASLLQRRHVFHLARCVSFQSGRSIWKQKSGFVPFAYAPAYPQASLQPVSQKTQRCNRPYELVLLSPPCHSSTHRSKRSILLPLALAVLHSWHGRSSATAPRSLPHPTAPSSRYCFSHESLFVLFGLQAVLGVFRAAPKTKSQKLSETVEHRIYE